MEKKETTQAGLVTNTFKELCAIWNPDNCKRLLSKVTNVNTAIKANTPSISALSRQYTDVKIEALIKIWLVNLNAVTSVNNPLSELQMDEIAFFVVNDYRNLTIADIHVIFRDAKMGKYGSLYENLSTDKVTGWFDSYSHTRMDAFESHSYNEHQQYKESGAEPRSSAMTVKDFIKNIEKK